MRPALCEAAGNRARHSGVNNDDARQLQCYNQFQSKWGGTFPTGQQNEVMGTTDDASCMHHLIDCLAMFDDSVSTRMCTQDCLSNGSPLDVEFVAGSTVQDSGPANGNGKQCFTATATTIRVLTSICSVKC